MKSPSHGVSRSRLYGKELETRRKLAAEISVKRPPPLTTPRQRPTAG